MRQKTLQQLTEKKHGLGVKSTWKCTVNYVSCGDKFLTLCGV